MEKHQAIQILNEQKDRDVGGWKILEYVNHGGSAAVYKATREGVSSALKIIDPGIVEKFGRDEQIERIRRESNLIDHSHPNLVRIFDADVCARTSYLYVAMEFLELPTLTKRIPEFPHERIISIISQIAGAAKYLEDQGFIHRDIKPDNIVMERDFSKAILLDLGVIRPASEYLEDITSSSAFLGTTRYSAPEYLQRSGAEKNIECWRALTFYQLGALLHDMIMRKRIFDEIDGPPVALTDAVRYKKPVVDNSACNHISNLARNCLEKDWELRLELVTWDDFLQSTELNEQKPAEHRIASRIEASRKSQGTKNIIIPRLSKRKTVERVRSQIIFLLREQCTDVGLFPALRIEGFRGKEENEATILLQTGPSEKHALQNKIFVKFWISILKYEPLKIVLRGLGSTDENEIDDNNDCRKRLFSGEIDVFEVEKRLKEFMLHILEAAQTNCKICGSNLLEITQL